MKKENKNNDSKSLDDYFVSDIKNCFNSLLFIIFKGFFSSFFLKKISDSWKMMNKYMSYEIN